MMSHESLLDEIEEWKQAASVEAGLRREFLARAEKAEAEIKRLRAALGPFAKAATAIDEWEKASVRPESPNYGVTHDDFRRARQALHDNPHQ
jgi:aminoglycoside phosphotransferase (APT) family kinase protein